MSKGSFFVHKLLTWVYCLPACPLLDNHHHHLWVWPRCLRREGFQNHLQSQKIAVFPHLGA